MIESEPVLVTGVDDKRISHRHLFGEFVAAVAQISVSLDHPDRLRVRRLAVVVVVLVQMQRKNERSGEHARGNTARSAVLFTC